MTFSHVDHQMMSHAISLAKHGIYTTAPNPNVGCVIAQGQKIVGQGAHLKAGEPHAEVYALTQAGSESEGATAYVTLEPCSHFGRTPPCAEALIKAKVARVVCAMQDPNPQVSGRGIQMLQDAGIDVQVGLLEQDAIQLNRGFIKKMQTGKPFVQLKLAASLDGKTALKNGESQWITSPASRKDVQVFRAQAGAILSTSKTVTDDNASLNVRWSDLPNSIQSSYPESNIRQPLRIILDRQNTLSSMPELKLFSSQGDILLVNSASRHTNTCEPVKTIESPLTAQGQFDLAELLQKLAQDHDVNYLWVEAGASLAASFIEQGLVDELIIYLAPKLLGTDGRGLTLITGLESMTQAIDLNITDLRMVGDDIRLTAQLRTIQ